MTYPPQEPPPPPDPVVPYQPPIQPYQPPPGYASPYQQPSGYASPYEQAADHASPYQGQRFQQPQGFYPPPPAYPYGSFAPHRETEGLAIASLVCACAGVLGLCSYGIGGVLGLVGAIFGHVARRRIARKGTGGAGMALAGIIVGWVLTAISVIVAALVIWVVVDDPS